MYDELSFADDHLLCIPANLIIPACINTPFLLILSEKGRVHNLFTHAFVMCFFRHILLILRQIAKEKGLFSIDDVIGGICEKMVRRHPWVFGGEKINSAEEGEALWARIKMQEKAKKP